MTLIQVDGRTVEYLSAGQGEPVLLCSPDWWPLDAWTLSGIPELSDCYQVVAFNQRGIGQSSSTPDDYTVQLFAQDTRNLSHGCVRLEDAERLARWLLGKDPPRASVPEQNILLPQPVPIKISYLDASSQTRLAALQ